MRAFAKINLDLRVGSRRPDGYHELRTIFQSVDLHDTVHCVVRTGPFAVESRTADVPLDDRNLVWAAAAALWRALDRPGDLRDIVITIEKRIPIGAGLGGGSSDAAAALLALVWLWRVAVTRDDLHRVAASVGAYVPFFLWGGTALGLGRGDEIYPLQDLDRSWVVLAQPPFGVSTAQAYEWYDEDRRGADAPVPGEPQPVPWSVRVMQPNNDLEAPVVRRHPELAAIKAALETGGALATAMSGSGSTMFGLFESPRDAKAALAGVRKAGAEPILTRTVSRDCYMERRRLLRLFGLRS
jgi:4-diphosphocytidyl-2-C-methyl-D-erythritol kinase